MCGFWKLLYCNAWNAENGFWKLLYCYIVTLEPMVSSDLFLLTVTFASVFLRHLLAYRDTSILRFWKSTVLPIHTTSWEAHYELPYHFLGFYPWISSLDFILRFLAMTELKRALFCSFSLTKTFHFMAPFLAMAELKRALFCSSGLTKMCSVHNQKIDGVVKIF